MTSTRRNFRSAAALMARAVAPACAALTLLVTVATAQTPSTGVGQSAVSSPSIVDLRANDKIRVWRGGKPVKGLLRELRPDSLVMQTDLRRRHAIAIADIRSIHRVTGRSAAKGALRGGLLGAAMVGGGCLFAGAFGGALINMFTGDWPDLSQERAWCGRALVVAVSFGTVGGALAGAEIWEPVDLRR